MVKAGCLRISCQTLVENISVYRLQSQREKLFVITPVLGVYMIFLGSHGSSCRDYIYIYMLFGKKYVLCIYIYTLSSWFALLSWALSGLPHLCGV